MKISVQTLLVTALVVAAGSFAFAEDLQLLDFELQDQFENTHKSSDVEGTIVLLIGSDKGGSQFNELWGKAIYDFLGDHPRYGQISHLAFADLCGVPFFLKGMIRSKFPENPNQWVLMDWKGVIAKAYDFAPKSSNVLVFGPDGVLVHHVSGQEPDDESIRDVAAELRTLLDDAGGEVESVPERDESP